MQIKVPFEFHGEHGVALKAMHGTQASSLGKGEVSWFFLSCSGNLGYIPELRRGRPFKARFCAVTSGILSSYKGHRLNLLEDWLGNKDSYRGDPRDTGYLSS